MPCKTATAVVLVQTPLGGPQNIGFNASLAERLCIRGCFRLVRGGIRKVFRAELLSLEGDRGDELRISPGNALLFGLRHGERVFLKYDLKKKVLYIRAIDGK